MANEEEAAIIAGTTTAPHEQQLYDYDVYLSFRGDTRLRFTGNLYNALRRKRIKTFMDDDGLKGGSQITLSLFKALEGSRVSIVVLSENFASSTYCLDELVKILECRKTRNQKVVPIFYDVEPSVVRHQKDSYGDAMARLEDRYGRDLERLQKWKSALVEVACLSGWVFQRGYEYEFVEKIVKNVADILTRPRFDVFLSYSEDTRYSFTGYLYDALDREGFMTFLKGKGLWASLEEAWGPIPSVAAAIGMSRLSIIVLSENYAYSPSSLDDLVTILQLMKTQNHLVWPIFYRVDPSDVRYQDGNYGKAMAIHENEYGKDSEKVKTWRSALTEVANLSGSHFKFGYTV